MDKDETETPMIFRRFKDGDIIAIMPTLPGTGDPFTCLSYQHVGQHGSCNPSHVVRMTAVARAHEYAELKAELTRIGYKVRAIQRASWRHYNARKDALDRLTREG